MFGGLGWRAGSSDIILKGEQSNTILTESLVPIGQEVSEEKIFLHIFPIGSYVKTMSADVGGLGWQDVVIGYNPERGPP